MWLVFALDLHLHIVESRNLSQFRDPFKFQLDARQISERWCNIMIAGLASFSVTLFPMQRFESRRCHFLHWRGCDNISERFGFTLFYKVAFCLCLQLNVGFSSIVIWPEFVLNLWLCVFCKFCWYFTLTNHFWACQPSTTVAGQRPSQRLESWHSHTSKKKWPSTFNSGKIIDSVREGAAWPANIFPNT